ncbi:transposase [Spirillospora sp. NPDC048819]|uniref:transposase n=1 Tax=Spirillospora sp. NPDC048819 TaxID=3155268 RepID=UPI0033C30080
MSVAVTDSGTTLTELHGIGDLSAAKILARTAGVDRFRSAAAFASYCGVAPLDASSGDVNGTDGRRPVIDSSTAPCTS